MRILVSGAGGQLGQELDEILPGRGHETVALSRVELNVADPEALAGESHSLVRAEVIHHYDLPWLERGSQNPLDVGLEGRLGGRSLKGHRAAPIPPSESEPTSVVFLPRLRGTLP